MGNPVELQRSLAGVSYPCQKADLIARAKQNGAVSGVIDQLNKLPDTRFSGPDDVTKAAF